MRATKKFGTFLIFLIASAIFLFLPKIILAEVVINELLPNPSSGSDWVEIYNFGSETVDVSGWYLQDTTSKIFEIQTATMSSSNLMVFDVSNRLNKEADAVYLYSKSGEEIDSYSYNYDPGTDVSFGKVPDGGVWGICTLITKGTSNNCHLPAQAPTSTPTPTTHNPDPTNTPTPTPSSVLTPTFTPTPTKKPTPTLTPTPEIEPSPSEEILVGTEDLSTPTINNEQGQVLGVESKNNNSKLPLIFIGLGLLLIIGSLGTLLLPKLKGYKLNKTEN